MVWKNRLLTEDGTEFGWQCGKCGTGWSNRVFGGSDGAAKRAADECCNRHCSGCGAAVESGYTLCSKCRTQRKHDRDLKLFRKAKKVTLADYGGECVCFGDDRYVSVDCIDNDEEETFAWGCSEIKGPDLDAWQILDHALTEHHEDAIESCDVEALQAVLDEWCKANEVTSYMKDESVVVVFSEMPELMK